MRTSPVTSNVGPSAVNNREGVLLAGTYNGVNRIFSLPETVAYDPPELNVNLYHNGRRMLPEEYEIYENVPGNGYDMVRIVMFAPQTTSKLMADYIAA